MAAFQSGDIVVYQVGNGSATLTSSATAVFLDEYNTSGGLVQQIALPSATSGANYAFTDSGSATSAGLISLSGDGTAILAAGYDAPVGTTKITSSTAAADPRDVAVVSASGTVDTTTQLGTTFDSGNNARSAAGLSGTPGSNVYAGTAGGTGVTSEGTTATPTTVGTANAEQVQVYNGQLYYSSQTAGATGVYRFATAAPTASSTPTLLAGTGTTTPYSFSFAHLNTAVPGTTPDTLYIADAANGGQIDKLSLVGGTYTATGTAALAGVTGITGEVVNGTFTLFATVPTGLYSLADASGYDGTLTGTPTQIAAASTNTAFRGDALAPVCYASGTLIRTARGSIAVERLAVGDLVVTASGARRPIRWLGHRDTDCSRHPEPRKVWPVRVRAGALGAGLPYADLWLSPGHALCLDDVLIPVRCLVQGEAVKQIERDRVTYWHVELDSHDILIANGVPAESYLDTGNRCAFDNAPGAVDLHPDFEARSADGFCRPLVESGPLLSAARRKLYGGMPAEQLSEPANMVAENSVLPGTVGDDYAPVHMVADGSMLRGTVGDDHAVFTVPAGTRDLRLVSPLFPADGADVRTLGVVVGSLTIEAAERPSRAIALDDSALFAGFYEIETGDMGIWRWTNGNAHFSPSLWADIDGAFTLRVGGIFPATRQAEPARHAA